MLTLQAIDRGTQTLLLANAGNTTAITKALAEIEAKFNIGSGPATARLLAASKLGTTSLKLLYNYGDQVNAAAARLLAVQQVPKTDLAYLNAHGTAVQAAQKSSPHQWQHWWWVCFGGQLVFLPFVFLLTGRWSPRRARRDADAHEAEVQRELAELAAEHATT